MSGKRNSLLRQGLSLMLLATMFTGSFGSVRAGAAGQPENIRLHVTTPDYEIAAGRVTVAGYEAGDVPGAPALPQWRTVVELPATGDWSLKIDPGDYHEIALDAPVAAAPTPDLALDGPVAWQDRDDLPQSVHTADMPDPAIYGVDAYYPAEIAAAGPEQWQRGRRLLAVQVSPFQYNPIAGALRHYPDISVTIEVSPARQSTRGGFDGPAPAQPVEVDGALRIYTGERGMYHLTYADLQSAGVPVDDLDPSRLAMAYLNQPADIVVTGAVDGSFDPGDEIIFYAEPYEGRYMTRNVYRLTYGGPDAGARMATRTVTPQASDPLITTITRTVRSEVDRDYRSTYQLPTNDDHWFDTALYVNQAVPAASATYNLSLGGPASEATGLATLRVMMHGGTPQVATPDQSVAVRVNGNAAGVFQWDGSQRYLATATIPTSWLNPSPSQVVLEAAISQLPALSYYWVSPDWVEISYPSPATAAGDRLYVEGIAVSSGRRAHVRAEGFDHASVAVYEVHDPHHPAKVGTVQTAANGGQQRVDFWDQWPVGQPPPDYFLTANEGLRAPLAVEVDTITKWLSPNHQADYIAIVHSSLSDAVQPLLNRRAAAGLRVAKVDVQDIYDEVSGGRVDPEAIRTFLAYAYEHWNGGGDPPQYVLLVGDGHYDFKDASGRHLPNLIPPYLMFIDPWLGETGADNRYVSVDGPDDYLPDMAIGRIPARTPADVTAYVNKVAAYEAVPTGDWQNTVNFLADRSTDPAGDFWALSDDVRLNWLPESYDDRTIYLGAQNLQTGAQMRAAIKSAFDAGSIYLQWFGHASQFRWGSTAVFDILAPGELSSNDRLPFSVHYGCWSGYFLGVQGSPQYGNNEQSLGEVLLLTPGKGSIADLSPSGLHVGSALQDLDQGLVKAIFQDRVTRVGDAVTSAKLYFYANSFSWHDVIDTSILFGDPALSLRLPAAATQHLFLPMVLAQ
ncbi:MAG: C25 family cysteine peptidase [Caldilineales bacterium]